MEHDYGDDDDDERTGNSQSCPAGRPKPVQKVGKINKLMEMTRNWSVTRSETQIG